MLIQSIKNPRIQALRALKDKKHRDQSGTFLVEGHKMVGEAMALSLVRTLIIDQRYQKDTGLQDGGEYDTLIVPEHILQTLSASKTPQGVVAEVAFPSVPTILGSRIVALDAVQDPGNVGTIIRTADAAGWDGVILGTGCADPYGEKALRATMGSVFRMPILKGVALEKELPLFAARDYRIYATILDGESVYQTRLQKENIVLMIGNESAGISPALEAIAQSRITLPMRGGAESLNAGVAAGILMYEWMREEQTCKQ